MVARRRECYGFLGVWTKNETGRILELLNSVRYVRRGKIEPIVFVNFFLSFINYVRFYLTSGCNLLKATSL